MNLGRAFSDNVIIRNTREQLKFHDTGPAWWLGAGRPLLFTSLLCIVFFVLLWRLFDLTIVQGHRYRALADGNRTRELTRHAPRGLLLDRTGKQLTINIPQYRLLKPCKTGDQTSLCSSNISQEEGDRLKQETLPANWFLEIDYRRTYPYNSALGHVTGYLGQLDEKTLASQYYSLRNYEQTDLVGKTGAEAVFEEMLRGKDGKELVEIDASGNIIRILGVQQEIPGQSVTLSLDATLSEAVQKAFPGDKNGAVIVSNPQTGEILALYSSPSFDPNIFITGLTQEAYQSIINDPKLPLFNRAIGGVYPPGSTFKIVTSIASLEEGAIKKNTMVDDTGVINIGSFSFPNWFFKQYGKTEGMVDIVRAIKRSNDIFFYKTGEFLGITKLAAWARKIGIGTPLGIELSGEAGGLMPDPSWKQKNINDEWYLGDTYHVSIGQGYLLTTPLQVNAWTNVIASGGKLCKPTINKIENGKWKIENDCKDLKIKKETIELISEGMKGACSDGGTGWPLFNFGIRKLDQLDQLDNFVSIPVACKTGTAEYGDPNNKTHAWFTVFAPLPTEALAKAGTDLQLQGRALNSEVISGEPEISVTVLVEGAGEGSDVAAPVAKKILEAWFSR